VPGLSCCRSVFESCLPHPFQTTGAAARVANPSVFVVPDSSTPATTRVSLWGWWGSLRSLCVGHSALRSLLALKANPLHLCALSCVVHWSTQPLHLYTGLILRQLGCNNL